MRWRPCGTEERGAHAFGDRVRLSAGTGVLHRRTSPDGDLGLGLHGVSSIRTLSKGSEDDVPPEHRISYSTEIQLMRGTTRSMKPGPDPTFEASHGGGSWHVRTW